MDCNWLEGLQSIYQLSNPITLFELVMFPHSQALMKRNEAGSPGVLSACPLRHKHILYLILKVVCLRDDLM